MTNPFALIPLLAAVAYIPLLAILLTNRPWQQRHRLFLLFLIPAILYSFITFLSMKGWLTLVTRNAGLDVSIVICMAILMFAQLHYLVRSFYESERIRIPLAYIFPIVTIVLLALPIAQEYKFTINGSAVINGPGIVAIYSLFLCTVGVNDVYRLIRKHRLSPNPAERSQIAYLLASTAIFTVFFLIGARGGWEFPIYHVGNLVVACILTYAVVAHRPVDIGLVARRAIMYLVLYGGGVLILLLITWTVLGEPGSVYFPALALIIALGIPAVVFLAHKMRDLWQRKVDDAFMGAKSFSRRQLSQFITGVQNASTLEELGNGFISLLAQSVDCRKACLLLPQAVEGGFSAQFVYPPAEDNPMGGLKLMKDSPIVTWLERMGAILPERSLSDLPEFQSIWAEEREEIQLAGVKMFIPLMNRGRIVAIAAISERRDGRLYTVEDIQLLESISAQVAASMEKEYSRERLKEQDQRTTLLNRLTSIITSSVSIQMIFEGFTQELKKVADIDWATIALVDGDELYLIVLSSTTESAWQPGQRIPLEGTATEAVCREKRTLYEPDLKRHQRFSAGELHLQQGIRSVVYLPLSITDRTIGSLILASREPNVYSQGQIKLLEKVALQIAAPIENAQLYARLEEKARTDELTGLFNRSYFEERLKEELSRHSRYGDAFSIFMIDLDNFKAYDDVHGHRAGDILLKHIGRVIRDSVRNVDQAFRYRGDEFAVILPQTARDAGYAVAERVLGQIAEEMKKRAIAVTASIGLASYPADGMLPGELVDMADTALHHAKRTGGNRIFIASKIPPKLEDGEGIPGIGITPRNLSEVYDIASAVEAKDPQTYGHSKKVNTYAVALAEKIALSPDQIRIVSAAALLHDIGKIGIPDKVLNKEGKLNEEDWKAIKTHPKLGANIISSIPSLAFCANIVLYHHERWDGGGYPEGLKGEQIPVEARIIAIANTFDVMTSAQPYRPAFSLDETIKELRKGAGSQFDPELVDPFIKIVEHGLPGKG